MRRLLCRHVRVRCQVQQQNQADLARNYRLARRQRLSAELCDRGIGRRALCDGYSDLMRDYIDRKR